MRVGVCECVGVCTFSRTVLASTPVCLEGRTVCVQETFPDHTITLPSLSQSPAFRVSCFPFLRVRSSLELPPCMEGSWCSPESSGNGVRKPTFQL